MIALLLALADPAAEVGSINDGILAYFKLIAILAGVLVVAVLAVRVWLPRMMTTSVATSGPIQVAARLALEPRKVLYVVKAGEDYFLVATSESGVHWLTALEGERIEPFLRLEDPANRGGGAEFSRVLRALRWPRGGTS